MEVAKAVYYLDTEVLEAEGIIHARFLIQEKVRNEVFRLGVFSLFIIFLFAFSVGAQEALELTGERLQYRLGEEEVVVYEGRYLIKISLSLLIISIFSWKKNWKQKGK